jgi:hypothetical protein
MKQENENQQDTDKHLLDKLSVGDVSSRLSDEQIELVANIFSKGNEHLLADMEVEWLLSHAFQLGAKFHRDFTNGL